MLRSSACRALMACTALITTRNRFRVTHTPAGLGNMLAHAAQRLDWPRNARISRVIYANRRPRRCCAARDPAGPVTMLVCQLWMCRYAQGMI